MSLAVTWNLVETELVEADVFDCARKSVQHSFECVRGWIRPTMDHYHRETVGPSSVDVREYVSHDPVGGHPSFPVPTNLRPSDMLEATFSDDIKDFGYVVTMTAWEAKPITRVVPEFVQDSTCVG